MFFFYFGVQKQTRRERGRPLCMHSGVVWTMGRRGKKHTCLQINWFGQEASKEELCVVKQACGEAGMSQQKHHRDHRERSWCSTQRRCACTHTWMHAFISTNAHTPSFQLCRCILVLLRVLGRLHSNHYGQSSSMTRTETVVCLVSLWQKINKIKRHSWVPISSAQTVAKLSSGEYYTVHPALCHRHMSTHCLPLGRRSLWLTKTQVTCHYTNEPCYSDCSVIHSSFSAGPKWNHIIMHLFIRRVETEWSSPLSSGRRAEQEPQCHVSQCWATEG